MSLVVNGDPSTYPSNPNLYVAPWLETFCFCFSVFNLSLAGITIVFQLKHPKSRRNMGRFFLLILILNTIDKANIFLQNLFKNMSIQLLQEIFFRDLSPVYYELKFHVWPRMIETKFCILFGFIKTFVDFLSQFYTLWLAVLIKQILKDPIHRLNRYMIKYNSYLMILYHILTIFICMLLCLYVQLANGFGVEETMQCGIMHTPGLDDEYVLLVPFLLVPFDIWLIIKIMRQTPFIVRSSLKRFVVKYIFTMLFLISDQGLQVALIIYGSRKQHYFSYSQEDGFRRLRYSYLVVDHLAFLCLTTCTLCERTFFVYAIRLKNYIFRKNRAGASTEGHSLKGIDSFKNMAEGSISSKEQFLSAKNHLFTLQLQIISLS